jgi:hypothetical protein
MFSTIAGVWGKLTCESCGLIPVCQNEKKKGGTSVLKWLIMKDQNPDIDVHKLKACILVLLIHNLYDMLKSQKDVIAPYFLLKHDLLVKG